MVFLTLATLLLLVVCAVQFAVAPSTARRFVRRRLSSPIDYEAGAHVHAALVRRTRVQTLGGAAGGVVALAVQWVTTADPPSTEDSLPRIAVVLTAVVLCGTLAEIVVAARDAPQPGHDVRVAALAARDSHLSRREGLAEAGLVVVTALVLVAAVVAAARDVPHAGGSLVCAVAALVTAATVAFVRRRLLDQPHPSGDEAGARGQRLLTAASADRFSETFVSGVSVLAAYAVLILVTDAAEPAFYGGLGVLVVLVTLSSAATKARSRARVAA